MQQLTNNEASGSNSQVQLSICCSTRTAGTASRLAARLERNLDIRTLLVQEDEASVSETWEEGAAADAVLICLDGLTAPPPMRREAWAGLIEHDGAPPVAFLRWEDCAYPKLLERRPFFQAGASVDRAVETWIAAMLPKQPGIDPAPVPAAVPEDWWSQLVDAPGQLETLDADAAQAFAHAVRKHFQAVVWIGCAGREPALIRAELDWRAPQGRVLAVLAHLDKTLKLPPSRHSVIQVVGPVAEGEGDAALGTLFAPVFPGDLAAELGAGLANAVPLDTASGLYRLRAAPRCTPTLRQRHLEALHRRSQPWRQQPERVLPLVTEVPAALAHGFEYDWPRASELCRRTAFLLLNSGRRREGIRLFHKLLVEAEERGDTLTAGDARHELSWLTSEDDQPLRNAPAPVVQLDLFGNPVG